MKVATRCSRTGSDPPPANHSKTQWMLTRIVGTDDNCGVERELMPMSQPSMHDSSIRSSSTPVTQLPLQSVGSDDHFHHQPFKLELISHSHPESFPLQAIVRLAKCGGDAKGNFPRMLCPVSPVDHPFSILMGRPFGKPLTVLTEEV